MNYSVRDLGRMSYTDALLVQLETRELVEAGQPGTLLFVEHDPVLTLGASFHAKNLLLTAAEYKAKGIQVVETDRGGDVTYHGPGQLVIYPIFDLKRHGQDLHSYLRDLEETMIQCVQSFGLEGRRFAPHTGCWIDDKKIAAIGIKVRKWISLHGIAINCNNDLGAFETIIPCGIEDYSVTSLSQELGRNVGMEEAKPTVIRAFETVFDVHLK